ncbi:MAG: filamentous hemagglutinin N-terminal domain-containing protein [Inhella sp.]
MTRCPFRTLALSAALTLAWPVAAQAQVAPIRTDGSAGPVVDIRGPLMLIPESLGKLQGANLFHSFQHFNIPTGETARFTVQSPGVAHVISRVTGGLPSFLDGSLELKAEQGSPAFYFINPAGVVFGSEARIDVPAGFHVSTAPQLQLADGSQWATTGGSSFSAAAPEAFGFLGGDRAAPIVLLPGAVLAPPRGESVLLAAGDIEIRGGQLVGSGALRLAATGDAATSVRFGVSPPEGLSGELRVGAGSFLFAAAIRENAAGPIELSAGSIALSGNSAISATTWQGGTGPSGAVSLRASDSIALSEGSYITTGSTNQAAAGDVRLQAQRIELSGSSYVQTLAEAEGSSGSVQLTASQELVLRDGGKVLSNAFAAGNSGDLLLQAPRLLLDSGAQVITSSYASGNAGGIRLIGSEQLRLANGGEVQSFGLSTGSTGLVCLQGGTVLLEPGAYVNSNASGVGNRTGDVLIQASGLLLMNQANVWTFGLEGATSADVLLTGQDIRLQGKSSVIASSLDGQGRPGSIGLSATGKVELLGESSVSSTTFSPFEGGTLLMEGTHIRIDQGSRVESSTYAAGNAGRIVLAATETLLINDKSSVHSATGGKGNSGQIGLLAKNITIDNQAMVFSNASAGDTGTAGDVLVQAEDTLRMAGRSYIDTSSYGLSSEGGNVLLQAGSLVEIGNASVLSTTYSSGRAGRVVLISDGLIQLNPAAIISTETGGKGSGGDIAFIAKEMKATGAIVYSRAALGSSGNAGSVSGLVDGEMRLEGSHFSSGTSGAGGGGSVDLGAVHLVLDGGSRVDARAEAGSSGQTGNINLVGTESLSIQGGSDVAISNLAQVASPGGITTTKISLAAPALRVDQGRCRPPRRATSPPARSRSSASTAST